MASASETPMDETESEEEEAEPSVDSSEGRYPIPCLEHYKPLEISPGAAANRKQLQ
jgi:hypothetical protein